MKLTRYLSTLILGAAFGVALTGCEKDGDIIYMSKFDATEVETSNTDIVLDADQLDALALSIYWNENGSITLTDLNVKAPDNAVTNVLQFSTTSDFSSVVEETMGEGVYYKQYTVEELNSIASRLGLEGGVKQNVYIRIVSSVAVNIDSKYSNVLTISLTPYKIDMTIGYVLDAGQVLTSATLYSENSDGIYVGFIGASTWYNWYMREGNNTIWGNENVNWTPFLMGNSTTDTGCGNFWYPGVAGCYYTIVNTQTFEWSALLVESLSLSGDVNGDMEYDRKSNVWTYTFNAAAAGTVNVTVSGNGKQYNVSTGTDDDAAIATSVGFSQAGSKLAFGTTASAIAVDVQAGENTLVLDLSNSMEWTLATGDAPAPADPVAPVLYLSGVYGEWTFDWYVSLYNEDHLCYGAVLPVDSEWGYRIYPEADNWGDYYTMEEGDGYAGTLVYGGEGNVAAPDAGLYLVDMSLSSLTYTLTAVEKVCYTGLNDDWGMYEMTATDTPGVYTATVTKSANTPWGVKILLNDSWDLYFGGNGTAGQLALYHDGFEGDNDLENGTYTLTVDLAKCTYSYSE